jgi:hypothetical protein
MKIDSKTSNTEDSFAISFETYSINAAGKLTGQYRIINFQEHALCPEMVVLYPNLKLLLP